MERALAASKLTGLQLFNLMIGAAACKGVAY
jgi:hypothetical protein